MREYYFSADGKIQYGEKYKHLADVTVTLPAPDEREGYMPNPVYDPETEQGYWEYVKIEPTTEEKIADLEQAIAELSILLAGGV